MKLLKRLHQRPPRVRCPIASMAKRLLASNARSGVVSENDHFHKLSELEEGKVMHSLGKCFINGRL
jgi:hypothetical protein